MTTLALWSAVFLGPWCPGGDATCRGICAGHVHFCVLSARLPVFVLTNTCGLVLLGVGSLTSPEAFVLKCSFGRPTSYTPGQSLGWSLGIGFITSSEVIQMLGKEPQPARCSAPGLPSQDAHLPPSPKGINPWAVPWGRPWASVLGDHTPPFLSDFSSSHCLGCRLVLSPGVLVSEGPTSPS